MTSEPPDRLIAFLRIQQQPLRQYFIGELAYTKGLLRGSSNGFSTFACVGAGACKHGLPTCFVDFFIVPLVTPPSGNLVDSLIGLVIVIDKTYSTVRK